MQQFFELLFGDVILHFDNLLPDVTLFEDFYRKVIQIDFQNPDTGLLKAINQLTLEPLHFNGLFRLVRADTEFGRHLGRRVRFAGWLLTGKTVRTKHDEAMEFLTFEDETGLVKTTFFPRVYKACCRLLTSGRA